MLLVPFLWEPVRRAEPPEWVVADGRGTIRILDYDLRELRRINHPGLPVNWSADGVVLKDGTRLARLNPADGAISPLEGRDVAIGGGKFVFEDARGLTFDGKPMLPGAARPAVSGDGSRVIFARSNGKSAGWWTAAIDGRDPRLVLRGRPTGASGWAADDRHLALAIDGHLSLLVGEAKPTDLGPGGPELAWSPGSPTLLARRGEGWAVYGLTASKWTPVPHEGPAVPTWIGAERLAVMKGGEIFEWGLDGQSRRLFEGVAAVRLPGLWAGGQFPSVFRDAPRPSRAARRWQGRVVSVDPIRGAVTMAVESELDAEGRETFDTTPEPRTFSYEPRAGAGLRVVRPGMEVAAVVDRGRLVAIARAGEGPLTLGGSSRREPAPRGSRGRRTTEYDGVSMDKVVVPMVYPFAGSHRFVDTFLAPRGGGTRRHHGNDLMAAKMRPALAVFDGRVTFSRPDRGGASNTLYLTSDDGWTAVYIHVNNDTPGTDDGNADPATIFPADLRSGDRVRAGQIVAYCGDSGNAESTDPHIHFELHDGPGGGILNPAPSLRAAERIAVPRVPDPAPDVRAEKGEERWDGVVREIDPGRGVVVIDVTARAKPGAPPRWTPPVKGYLRIPTGGKVRLRDDSSSEEYGLDSLRPGLGVTAVGSADGSRLSARRLLVGYLGGG